MRGSPSDRSWPWVVSLTMAQESIQAAARAANPASPHGETSYPFTVHFQHQPCDQHVEKYKRKGRMIVLSIQMFRKRMHQKDESSAHVTR